MPEWSDFLSRKALRDHELWLENDRLGEGRLVLQDRDLTGARSGGTLDAARLLGCTGKDAQFELSSMREIELAGCQFPGASLRGCDLEEASLLDCSFCESNLRMIDLINGKAVGCNFSGSLLDRSSWNESHITQCSFARCNLQDATFDDARFEGCDFRAADLSWTQGPPLGTALKTRFLSCDFRGANFNLLRLESVIFDKCALHGLLGQPTVQMPCLFINCDFSPDYNGTHIASGKSPWQKE